MKTEELQKRVAKEIGRLSKRDLLILGCALYWAEGNKKERWSVRFCNSDPEIISLNDVIF